MRTSWRIIVFAAIIYLSIQTSRGLCPSPLVTYAVEGDNATLCWKITVNLTEVTKFTVVAIKKPVQQDLERISSANNDGSFFRTYHSRHNGLYVGKARVYADISAGNLFFELTNYTSAMSNLYCALYERVVINSLLDCIDHPLFLRNYVPTTTSATATATVPTCAGVPTTNATETQPPTKGEAEARTDERYLTPFIIVSCFLGALSIVLIVTVLSYRKCVKNKEKNSSKNKRKAHIKQVVL